MHRGVGVLAVVSVPSGGGLDVRARVQVCTVRPRESRLEDLVQPLLGRVDARLATHVEQLVDGVVLGLALRACLLAAWCIRLAGCGGSKEAAGRVLAMAPHVACCHAGYQDGDDNNDVKKFHCQGANEEGYGGVTRSRPSWRRERVFIESSSSVRSPQLSYFQGCFGQKRQHTSLKRRHLLGSGDRIV